METILWSCAIELLIIALIWWRVHDRAKPFLVTAGFVVVEMLAMAFASDFPVVKGLDVAIGHTPGGLIWLAGFAIGAATSWAGWQAGKQPAVPVRAVPLPA